MERTASRTRRAVSAVSICGELKNLDTVAEETPAAVATWSSVLALKLGRSSLDGRRDSFALGFLKCVPALIQIRRASYARSGVEYRIERSADILDLFQLRDQLQ